MKAKHRAKRGATGQRRVRAISSLLRALSRTHPRLAANLRVAHSNRQTRLDRLSAGVRLAGYEELLGHLEELEAALQKHRRLKNISFLIGRAHGDFVTAMEAALSGFHSVCHDAMRDVMEIEFLLRDFLAVPDHMEQWLSCTEKERNDRFRPAILRQRHAQRLGRQPQDIAEASDYKGHSQFLHVTPVPNPFGGPGLKASGLPWADDSCFWEIFEHARRLLFAIHGLRRKIAPRLKTPVGLDRGLKKFRTGWERTQEMQQIFMALIEASRTAQASKPSSGTSTE